MVDDPVRIAVLPVGHLVFEVNSCPAPLGNMVTVDLPFLGPREGGVCLQQNRFEFTQSGGQGDFLDHGPCLPESVGPNDKEARPPCFPLYRLPPSGIGVLLSKIDMETANDFRVTHQGPETQPKLLPLPTRSHDEEEKALVSGGHVQGLPEAVEVLHDRSLLRSPCSKSSGHMLHRLDDTSLPGSPPPAQSLRRASSRSRQPAFPVRGKQAKRRVLEAPVQEGSYHLLVFLVLVGLQPHTHESPRSLDKLFLREQTVLRLGVARSEYPGNTTAGCRGRHEEDRPMRAFGLGEGGFPSRVPGHARLPHRLGTGSEIGGTGPLAQGDSPGHQGAEKNEQFHMAINKRSIE